MIIKKKRIKSALLGTALAVCFAIGGGVALSPNVTATAEFSGKNYDGYTERLTETSTAVEGWKSGYPEISSPDYAFSAEGSSLKLPDSVSTGVAEVNLVGEERGETILQFTASLEARDKWNFVVFRGDEHYNSFTALMFRADGVMTMMSRAYDANKAAETPSNPYIWYSYADLPEAPNAIFLEPVEKNCEIAVGISTLSNAESTVDMTVISTQENVRVYIGDGETPVYESPLTVPLASAAGIFAYNAPSYCNAVKLTNLRCYDSLDEGFSGKDYEGYTKRLTETSTAVEGWKSGYPEISSPDYAFSAEGSSLKLPDSVSTGVAEVNLVGAELGETILQFTASLEARDKWNFVVFRGDEHYNSFTALMFRADGVMTMMSRAYDANKAAETPSNPYIWYSYADLPEAPNAIFLEPVEKNCEIAVGISALSNAGSTVDMTVISTKESVRVYIGNGETPVYESPLTIPLASTVGIFAYNAPNYCNAVKLTNLRCYDSLDYVNWNNAVTEESLVYSPYGGGGAVSEFGENGATLNAGSSIGNTAVFTMPDVKDRKTVHTYSFTLNNSDTTYWSDMLLRANDDMSEYLVLRVRRMGQHVGLYGRIGGKNYTYSTEPFSGSYKDDFTAGYNDNDYVMCFPLGAKSGDFPKGTQLNFMIVTDNNGCTVYNNGSLFYSVNFKATKGYNPNTWDLSEEIAKLKPAVGTFGGDASSMFAINTYSDSTTVFSNINCYYTGEKGVDTQKDTFLKGISYKGNLLTGFTPGSFESDMIISGKETFDRDALTFEKGLGVTEVETEWHTDEKFGYEQAVIIVKSEIATRRYTLTFETYDPPVPFDREDWDELNEKNQQNQGGQNGGDNSGETEAGCASFVGSEFAALGLVLLAFVSVCLSKKGEKR